MWASWTFCLLVASNSYAWPHWCKKTSGGRFLKPVGEIYKLEGPEASRSLFWEHRQALKTTPPRQTDERNVFCREPLHGWPFLCKLPLFVAQAQCGSFQLQRGFPPPQSPNNSKPEEWDQRQHAEWTHWRVLPVSRRSEVLLQTLQHQHRAEQTPRRVPYSGHSRLLSRGRHRDGIWKTSGGDGRQAGPDRRFFIIYHHRSRHRSPATRICPSCAAAWPPGSNLLDLLTWRRWTSAYWVTRIQRRVLRGAYHSHPLQNIPGFPHQQGQHEQQGGWG